MHCCLIEPTLCLDSTYNVPFILVRDTFVANPEFEGLSVGELIDPSLTNWVHHIQYILPQVRTNTSPFPFQGMCVHPK
jgi:hypothetical protein